MNEELLQELKKIAPYFLAAAVIAGGWYGYKAYTTSARAAASNAVVESYSTDELMEAVSKYGSTAAGGVLKLRLAKSYYEAERYQDALDLYNELAEKAPKGFEEVPAIGAAHSLEALEKFVEAEAAYRAFVAAHEKGPFTFEAKLGAIRCVALAGDKAKAKDELKALEATVADDEMAKARIETTLDVVNRYEKRAAISLFDAADAAAKEVEAPKAEEKPAEAPAAPAAPAAEAK